LFLCQEILAFLSKKWGLSPVSVNENPALSEPGFLSYFHGLAAAAGDHFSGLQVQHLMADGAIYITLFFCLLHKGSKGIVFH
jgi:hypothetical protein